METLEIPFSALVSVPLLMCESHTVDTKELREYKITIAALAAKQNKRISFETSEQAKTYFEITRHFLIVSEPIEEGETRYTVKLGMLDLLNNELFHIDKNILDLLTMEEALKEFNKGRKQTLTKQESE